MIRKLKIRFVVLSMAALCGLLTIIVVGMNFINYNSVVNEADEILSVLSKNKGAFPDYSGNKGGRFPHNMSPETPYESRYFSVLLDESYKVMNTETSRIKSVSDENAIEFAQTVIKKKASEGFIDEFRYTIQKEVNGYRIIFLDCGRKLQSYHNFLYASIGMALAGMVITFLIIFVFSGKIIKPIAESYDKQKQFT